MSGTPFPGIWISDLLWVQELYCLDFGNSHYNPMLPDISTSSININSPDWWEVRGFQEDFCGSMKSKANKLTTENISSVPKMHWQFPEKRCESGETQQAACPDVLI